MAIRRAGGPVTNPLYERQRQSHRSVINGVPLDVLGDLLPEPLQCVQCHYPVWQLDDPSAVTADGTPMHVTMAAEYQVNCVDPKKQHLVAPLCGHAYHLVKHECRGDRPWPLIPADLISRRFGARTVWG